MRMISRVRDDLPTGTVTFVFTDIEGSTRMLEELGAGVYGELLARHHAVCRAAWMAHGGVEVDTAGDAFFVAFPTASGALAAAAEAQEELDEVGLRVRMGLHTGEVTLGETGYVGFEVHRAARIAAAAHGGQVVLSAAAAAGVDADELTQLGEHRFKDIDEPIAIFQLGSAGFPPLKTLSNTNLPRPASSFIGREREREEVVRELRQGARLLTLTGPGGSGKTRLALEAAVELVPSYRAGVYWIGLAALREASLVTEAIAQMLGARDELAAHIGDREMLLLLDNLEQVIEAAPELSTLVQSCPNLALLVTSRELLRVQGEVQYSVPPLAPSEAVALFCERSGLDRSAEISELCTRLDDLPLAVELAAARSRALSPPQILERLALRLDLLRGGRDADARQQTLRATIAWSYDLASPDEQRLLRVLSIFAGGCTLNAAEEVASASIDTLQSLVEKSLLRFADERYWMLETIREYASELFEESPDAEALRNRHARYFLARLEEHQSEILGLRRAELLAWFDDEEANLRTALDRLEEVAVVDAARAAGQLRYFWIPRGQVREGRERTEALLAHDDLSTGLRAALLELLSDLEGRMGDAGKGESHAEDALQLAKQAGESRVVALALHRLSFIAFLRGDLDDARSKATQMLEEAGDDLLLRSVALGHIGSLEVESGRDVEARMHLVEAIDGSRSAGDVASELITLIRLAYLELYTHEFREAQRVALSVLDRATGDHYRTIGALNALGLALVGLSRHVEAREAFADSLDRVVSSGMTGEGLLTETLAGIAHATDKARPQSAARLLGVVHRLDDEEGLTPSSRRQELERFFMQPVIDALGDEEYASEQAAGAAMTRDEAIDLALSLVTVPPPRRDQVPTR